MHTFSIHIYIFIFMLKLSPWFSHQLPSGGLTRWFRIFVPQAFIQWIMRFRWILLFLLQNNKFLPYPRVLPHQNQRIVLFSIIRVLTPANSTSVLYMNSLSWVTSPLLSFLWASKIGFFKWALHIDHTESKYLGLHRALRYIIFQGMARTVGTESGLVYSFLYWLFQKFGKYAMFAYLTIRPTYYHWGWNSSRKYPPCPPLF